MNYTIVSGTNRKNSQSFRVAEFYKELFKEQGVEAKILSLKDLPHDFVFNDTFGKRTEAFKPVQALVSGTDKFVFIIAEYNGSFPGILKSFIDACDFPESFKGKKACLVGLSAGRFGNLRGLEHFVGIAHYIKLEVFSNKIYLPAVEKLLGESGAFKDEFLLSLVKEQISDFIAF